MSASGAVFSVDISCCQWGGNPAARCCGRYDVAVASAASLLNMVYF